MDFIKQTFHYLFLFLKRTMNYSRDVLFLHISMLFGIIPFLGTAARWILRSGDIPYLSFDNVGDIFLHHPFVLLGLASVILLLLASLFFECTFLLTSMYYIKIQQPLDLWTLLKFSIQTLKTIRPATVLFFLFYFLLILPFGGIGYHSEVLAQLKIPAFLLDFIYSNRLIFLPLLALGYLFFLYLGIRFLFVLPLLILEASPLKKAIQKSWALTKKNFFRLTFQAIFLYVLLSLFFVMIFLFLFAIQLSIERFLPHLSFYSAMIAMLLLQIGLLFYKIFSGLVIFFLIFEYLEVTNHSLLHTQKKNRLLLLVQKKKWLQPIVIFFSLLFVFMDYLTYDYRYLSGTELSMPLLLSHRGVDEENGVQNSIEALIDTAKQHPAYVEMDIQETKDHQFVVMHDFSLKDLTGVNQRVKQLTLKQLQQLTVREHGMKAAIPTFDDYLKTANQLGQKLLVEVKIDRQPIQPILDRFVQRYQQDLLAHHHIVHSLNFDFTTQLKQKVPDLYVGYIMPFNIVGTPLTNVDFFSIEYSTLTSHFVQSAHEDGKKVYAWTINNQTAAIKVLFDGVDGILTDRVSYIKTVTEHLVHDPAYSDLLFNFVLGFE